MPHSPPHPRQRDPDDVFGIKDNPMALRELLEAHDAINTPWFRVRFFFCLRWQMLRDWFIEMVLGDPESQLPDSCDRDQDAVSAEYIDRSGSGAIGGSSGTISSKTPRSKGHKAMSSFIEQLPSLLRQLADPTTPHTIKELWCRIAGDEWDRHAPTLLHELRTGENDVKRLVLSIFCEQANIVRSTPLQPFLAEVERLLTDNDRLMRMAAIVVIRDLSEMGRDLDEASPALVGSLRRIGCHDELPLAREALLTLLEIDDGAVREIASLLRERKK